MHRLPSVILVLASVTAAGECPLGDTPEHAAMQFVTAAFFERNVDKAAPFIDRDAERKRYGKGSLIRDLRTEIPRMPSPKELVLQEIHFAHSHDLERIGRRMMAYISERNEATRKEAQLSVEVLRKELRVDDSSFVTYLIWRNVPEGKNATMAHMTFVFNKIEDEYKIVFMTDD